MSESSNTKQHYTGRSIQPLNRNARQSVLAAQPSRDHAAPKEFMMVTATSSISPVQINPLTALSQGLSTASSTAQNAFAALAQSTTGTAPAPAAASGVSSSPAATASVGAQLASGVTHHAHGHHHHGGGAAPATSNSSSSTDSTATSSSTDPISSNSTISTLA